MKLNMVLTILLEVIKRCYIDKYNSVPWGYNPSS